MIQLLSVRTVEPGRVPVAVAASKASLVQLVANVHLRVTAVPTPEKEALSVPLVGACASQVSASLSCTISIVSISVVFCACGPY